MTEQIHINWDYEIELLASFMRKFVDEHICYKKDDLLLSQELSAEVGKIVEKALKRKLKGDDDSDWYAVSDMVVQFALSYAQERENVTGILSSYHDLNRLMQR